jgi:BirA family biotin operon repressor/biotin-[acetyl-CoA-carboxylase] ligase
MLDISVFTKLLRTEEFGRQLTWLDAPYSTNSSLWHLVDNNAVVGGHLVITDGQRNGRGRADRSWFSQADKSLCFSLLLEVDLEPQLLGLVSLAGGVAVAQALAGENLPVALKWPNDIVHQERKLGGILTESRLGVSPTKVVLGIGLNVSQTAEDFPAALDQTATSIYLLGGGRIEREPLLVAILLELEKIVQQDFRKVTSSWMKYCAHKDSIVAFHQGAALTKGRFTGLTDQGQALIETAAGIKSVSAGDMQINGDDEI